MKPKFLVASLIAVAIVALSLAGYAPEAAAVLALGPMAYPGLEDFRREMKAQFKGDIEIVWFPLYDTLLYPTAGVTNLRFYQNPIGQALSVQVGNAASPKTLQDTNLDLAGQLASPQGFFVHSIELDFQPGSSAAANTFAVQVPTAFAAANAATVQSGEHDVNAFYTGGGASFVIGNKSYYQDSPLLAFPPRSGFELQASSSTTSATAGLVTKGKLRAIGPLCMLNPGVAIPPGANFSLQLAWPAVIATPSGFNGKVTSRLNGWLFRGIQ